MKLDSLPQRLIVNWQCEQTREFVPVGELLVTHADGGRHFEFGYLEGARRARSLGFQPFMAFASLDKRYRSDQLFAFFRNRVMPSTREDYLDYVTELGLEVASADVVELLGRSGGRRETDRVETVLAPQHDEATHQYATRFLVRGVRHVAGAEAALAGVRAGQRLEVEIDRFNPVNRRARRLSANGRPIGFVPDYLVGDIDELERAGSTPVFEVERVNPPPKPVHYRALVRVTAAWPDGFQPLSGRAFERFRASVPPAARHG
jgi:hypothetical protein